MLFEIRSCIKNRAKNPAIYASMRGQYVRSMKLD